MLSLICTTIAPMAIFCPPLRLRGIVDKFATQPDRQQQTPIPVETRSIETRSATSESQIINMSNHKSCYKSCTAVGVQIEKMRSKARGGCKPTQSAQASRTVASGQTRTRVGPLDLCSLRTFAVKSRADAYCRTRSIETRSATSESQIMLQIMYSSTPFPELYFDDIATILEESQIMLQIMYSSTPFPELYFDDIATILTEISYLRHADQSQPFNCRNTTLVRMT